MSLVLMCGMPQTRIEEIEKLFRALKFRCKKISRTFYSQSVGFLGEVPGTKKNSSRYDGADFTQEMIIMCDFDENDLDSFLAEFKKQGVSPVDLKAVLTPNNLTWTVTQLYGELLREHNEINNKMVQSQ